MQIMPVNASPPIIIRRVFFGRWLVDRKGSIRRKYGHWFQYFMPLSDFMYLPLAILFGLFRIVMWIVFALFSYARPDINMYPRGLEDWDYGHLAGV